MPFDPEMDKQRLLDLNHAEHDFLRRTVEAVPDWHDHWSVRDALAHVAAWEERFVGWVEAAEQGEHPDRPVTGYTPADIDRINAEIYAAHKNLTYPEALALFERSFHRFQSKLASLPEEALFRPGYFAFTGKHPLWRFAASNGFEHYREHAAAIRATAK